MNEIRTFSTLDDLIHSSHPVIKPGGARKFTIREGDKVVVCDGTEKPPRHHSRKLRRWHDNNFSGTVTECWGGSIYVRDDARSGGVMTLVFGCRPEHVFPFDQVKPEILDRLGVTQ